MYLLMTSMGDYKSRFSKNYRLIMLSEIFLVKSISENNAPRCVYYAAMTSTTKSAT
jgi:hypothetical protein